MTTRNEPRRLQVVVSDEETGEEIASAEGVETLILLVSPDSSREGYRRILLGDPETSVQLLFDILQDVSESMERGTMLDLTEVLDDRLLLEVTDELPMH
jgi:hypothetical protein